MGGTAMKRHSVPSPAQAKAKRHGRVTDPVASFCLHMMDTSRERVTRGLFSHFFLQRTEYLAHTRRSALEQVSPLLRFAAANKKTSG